MNSAAAAKKERDRYLKIVENVYADALKFDKSGNHAAAVRKYTDLVNYIMKAANYEPQKVAKDKLIADAGKYLGRAEFLKQQITGQNNFRAGVPTSSGVMPTELAEAPAPPPTGKATAFAIPDNFYTSRETDETDNGSSEPTAESISERLYPTLPPEPVVQAPRVALAPANLPRLDGELDQFTIKKPRIWKTRYLRLEAGQLKLYKGRGGFPKQTFDLRGVRVDMFRPSDSTGSKLFKKVFGLAKDQKTLPFTLIDGSNQEILVVHTKYPELRQRWIDAINKSIRLLQIATE